LTFGEMLKKSSKCTFSLDLKVKAKHTNGFSFIGSYDSYDEASFALEVVTP